MVNILDPQEGETIYDPCCGTGGMLLAAVEHVRERGGDPRTFFGKLYGQERNLTTASVARMNLFLHGIEDFVIECGDTLRSPVFSDPSTGGVLFRREEAEMCQKLVEADLVECVLGLGPNLFYNSPMEACVVVCRSQKPPERQGQVLFIDAVNEVARERAQSTLKPEHQARILAAYHDFGDPTVGEGLAYAATRDEIAAQGYSLSIPLYVNRRNPVFDKNRVSEGGSLPERWAEWEREGRVFWQGMDALVDMLDELVL